MSSEIKEVLVVGYGVMGRGIALTFARSGHRASVLSRAAAKAGGLRDSTPVTWRRSMRFRLRQPLQVFAARATGCVSL